MGVDVGFSMKVIALMLFFASRYLRPYSSSFSLLRR